MRWGLIQVEIVGRFMKTFVTGSTGFLGAYLLYYLLKEGYEIKALRRPTSQMQHLTWVFHFLGKEEGLEEEVIQDRLNAIEWVYGDLQDIEQLNEALQDVQAIYHAAAKVSFNERDRDSIIQINVEGTANLVNLAIENNVRYFFHVSSVSSLKRHHNQVTTEEMNEFPKQFPSIYGESKFRAEREVWKGFAEGLKGLIVNPGVILGPGDLNTGALSIFQKVLDGLSFYPKGSSGFVDARDVAEGMIRLSKIPEAYDKRYIMVAESVSMQKALNLIAEGLKKSRPKIPANLPMSLLVAYGERMRSRILGQEPIITPNLARMGSSNYYFDASRFKQITGMEFRPFKETVKDTCDFILSHVLQKGSKKFE